MLGGPVLPSISKIQRRPDLVNLPQFHAPYAGPHGPAPSHHGPSRTNGSPPSTLKRHASQTPLPDKRPAKKQPRWTPEEDNLTIELRGQGMKWDDIAKRLPGRSSLSCRLRYQNYLEKRVIWDEEMKNKLARLYARLMDQMWQKVATEMGVPWRSAESMHWQLGEQEMIARANAPVFQLGPSVTGTGMSSPSHGLTSTDAPQLIPNPPPTHQMPPPMPQGPWTHGYGHRRTDSGFIVGKPRRRSSSFNRRRTDPRSRPSISPQLGQPLPQIQPRSEDNGVSGAGTAVVAGIQPIIKRKPNHTEVYDR